MVESNNICDNCGAKTRNYHTKDIRGGEKNLCPDCGLVNKDKNTGPSHSVEKKPDEDIDNTKNLRADNPGIKESGVSSDGTEDITHVITEKHTPYRIFISHSYDHSEDYQRLLELLNQVDDFNWTNLSVPKEDPLADSSYTELREQIGKRITQADIILMMSAVYADQSHWIKTEIQIAHVYNKPIIGIKPWGRKWYSNKVKEAAVEIVGWDSQNIVDEIVKRTR